MRGESWGMGLAPHLWQAATIIRACRFASPKCRGTARFRRADETRAAWASRLHYRYLATATLVWARMNHSRCADHRRCRRAGIDRYHVIHNADGGEGGLPVRQQLALLPVTTCATRA